MTTPAGGVTLPELLRGRRDNALRHGHARHGAASKATPTYQSWCAMLTRSRNPHRHNADRYAAITVCERWQSFEAFLADMGERPVGTTLDRVDNARGYEPGNCRWASATEQARNRSNARLTFAQAVEVAKARMSGETCASIARRYGCSESLPREIMKGRTWPDALAAAKEQTPPAAPLPKEPVR